LQPDDGELPAPPRCLWVSYILIRKPNYVVHSISSRQ
jgi:hypothetical protein